MREFLGPALIFVGSHAAILFLVVQMYIVGH
jgi:hypothetical protein